MKKRISLLLTLFITTLLWSQQDAQYTQYMYNMSVINPAYTTSTPGVINFGGIYRSQWVGVNGAPKTASIFAHSPINNKMEVGLSYMNDNIGNVVKENNIFADFAYKLDFEDNGILSFGVKVGANFFNVNFSNFNLESGSIIDPSFAENINEAFFNFGTGVYYNTDRFYVGLSVPTILNSKHLNKDDGKYQTISNPHFYLTGGYVFDLSEQFKFKPAFMIKAVSGAPMEFDLTANFLYNNRLEFGAAYRFNDAVSGLINFAITPELRIGYAYDYTVSDLNPYSSGSHEFLLLYNLGNLSLSNGFDKSPRFF